MCVATKFSCLLQATCTGVLKENLQIYKEASCWNSETMKVYFIYFQMFHTWSSVSYNFNNGDTLRLKHLKVGCFFHGLSFLCYLFLSQNMSKSCHCLSWDIISVFGFHPVYQHLFKTWEFRKKKTIVKLWADQGYHFCLFFYLCCTNQEDMGECSSPKPTPSSCDSSGLYQETTNNL